MEVENFYKSVKSTDDGLRHYPNEKLINITLPARVLLIGPTGSGKTNVVMNLIKGVGIFDKIVLLAKDLEEPLYKHLIEAYRKVEKKNKCQILLAITDLKDLPSIDDFDPKENSFFVCDDFICDSAKDLAKVEEFYIRGRKKGISMAFLTQSYFDTPKKIRKNTNYIIVKKVGGAKDMKRILAEYKLNIGAPELERRYHHAVDGDMTNFFMIDNATTDERLRFRKNFAPM
jgi:energy-coupling factor transporter ATP-binding protein EcfA2